MLVMKLQISIGNRIRVEHAIGAIILPSCAFGADAPVNDEMTNMNI